MKKRKSNNKRRKIKKQENADTAINYSRNKKIKSKGAASHIMVNLSSCKPADQWVI